MRHFESVRLFLELMFSLEFVCRSPRIKKKEKQKQDKEIARFVGLITKSREVRSGYVLFRSLALTRAIIGICLSMGKYCPGGYLSVARLEFIPIHCHYRTDDTDLE